MHIYFKVEKKSKIYTNYFSFLRYCENIVKNYIKKSDKVSALIQLFNIINKKQGGALWFVISHIINTGIVSYWKSQWKLKIIIV